MSTNTPPCFYRVSIKALIMDETRTKFLVVQEQNGEWEFPGGGLEWGSVPQDDLRREIEEEMKLVVTEVATHPSYFLTCQNHKGDWIVNVFFETRVQDLAFTPSDECIAIRFVTPDEARTLPARFGNISKLADMFDPLHLQDV